MWILWRPLELPVPRRSRALGLLRHYDLGLFRRDRWSSRMTLGLQQGQALGHWIRYSLLFGAFQWLLYLLHELGSYPSCRLPFCTAMFWTLPMVLSASLACYCGVWCTRVCCSGLLASSTPWRMKTPLFDLPLLPGAPCLLTISAVIHSGLLSAAPCASPGLLLYSTYREICVPSGKSPTFCLRLCTVGSQPVRLFALDRAPHRGGIRTYVNE